MRVRSFTAATMPEAIARVRAELGDGAVILSSVRGKRGVEVKAGVEDAPAPRFVSAGPIENELERKLLEQLNARARPAAAPDMEPEALRQRFAFHELPALLAARLADAVSRPGETDATTALAQSLDRELAFDPLAQTQGGVIALFGPPGAGKTATAAKLAVRAVLAGIPATLVSCDTGAGAAAQIDAFAALIRTPVLHAGTPDALSSLVAPRASDTRHLTIVDTAGINPFEREALDGLAAWLKAAGGEPIMVLPATGGSDLEDMAAAMRPLRARRLIVTKLDMARRLGGLVRAALGGRLAFSLASSSPYIADLPETMQPFSLARRLAGASPLPESQ